VGAERHRGELRPIPWIARYEVSALSLLLLVLLLATDARGDSPAGFLDLRSPGRIGINLFGSGFGSDTYARTTAGLQIEQSVTHYVNVVARAASYQIYQGKGYDSPFSAGVVGTRTFERFQGGIDLVPLLGTSLTILGGHDVGNSSAPVVEGDFSTWLLFHSTHPINFAFNSTHFYQNEVTSSRIDLRTVAFSTGNLLFLAGGGGAIWGGGSVGKPNGQGGVDLSLYVRRWNTHFELQSGYGSSHLYGLVGFSTHLGWDE